MCENQIWVDGWEISLTIEHKQWQMSNHGESTMKSKKIYISACVGAIIGYFVIHPLLMMISHLMLEGRLSHAHLSIVEIFTSEGVKAFSVMMIPWAFSLTVLGGLVGLYYQKNHQKTEETISAQERLNHLLTAGPAVIYSCSPSEGYGGITYISKNILTQLGYEPRQFIEESGFWLQHIHPEDRDRVTAGLPRLIEQGHHVHEYRFRDNTGNYKWMRDELRLIRDEGDYPLEIIGSLIDISELKHSQKKLQEEHDNLEHRVNQRTAELKKANEQLKFEVFEREKAQDEINRKNKFLTSVIESLPYPFYVIDAQNYLLKMANRKVIANEKWKGKTCYTLTHHRETPCETSEHGCPLDVIKRTGKPAILEHLHFDEKNQPRHVEVHGYPIFDDQNNIAQMIEYAIDISERKKLEEKLRHLSTTDELTGSYNRRAFNDSLLRNISRAKRHNEPLSMLMLDVDHFKKINDLHGHDVGDLVLKDLVRVIKESSRQEDIIARWGGEEFTALLPKTGKDVALQFAERLKEKISAHVFPKIDHLTVSFGITELQTDDTSSSFIKRADKALYLAKKEGRNTVRYC